MKWISGITMGGMLVMTGCQSVTGPPELEKVLAELVDPTYAGALQENPRLQFLPNGRVRVQVSTYHPCPMRYSDPTITRDGNSVGIILYEVRGPCNNSRRGYGGTHDFNVDFEMSGPASIEILALYYNRPSTFTELFDIQLEGGG